MSLASGIHFFEVEINEKEEYSYQHISGSFDQPLIQWFFLYRRNAEALAASRLSPQNECPPFSMHENFKIV